jgi:hypothetical protein
MPLRFSILFLCLTILPGHAQSAAPQIEDQQAVSVAQKLAGAWRLVSIETLRPNKEVIYPFYGKHPEGLLIYDRSGWMSVQIVSDPKPAIPNSGSREGMLAASAAEKANAIESYYAYLGTWTVDPSGGRVTHHIRQSLYPGEQGQDGVRELSLVDDRLTLSSNVHEMGEDHVRRLVWQRVQPVR